MKPALVVRRIIDDKEMHRVEVSSISEQHIDRVFGGMLINMNTDEYYIDESEIETARESKKKQ